MRGEIDDTVFKLTQLQNEDVWNIIESFQLNTKSRREDVAYKRYYLYNFLYNHRHMTFSMIGKFFNRDHSSVIHGMREHQYWYGKKDSRYLKYIHPLPDLIKAKRDDIGIFDVNVMPLCDEEARITITGNIPPKLLTKFEDKMSASDLIHIFATHNFLRVNTGEGGH
jgi:hypothetical protein